MTKHKYEHQRPPLPDQEISDVRVPYWHRAHRDWRFWAVLFLMLAAMGTYVTTLNLSWRPRNTALPLVVPAVK